MSSDELAQIRRSALDATHRDMGASFATFSGWQLPLRFSGELAEHHAVRSAAGLFDISHMGQLVVQGRDAATLLAYALVSDVSLLEINAARYTMACDERGGVVDDLIVYRLQDEEFLVICNAANVRALLAHLGSLQVGMDVRIDDSGSEWALMSIQGPRAIEVVAARTDSPLVVPSRYRVVRTFVAGHEILLARTGYTGEDGFEISLASIDADEVWRRLLDDASDARAIPAGLAARDSLRLEAGLPLYGHELDVLHTPITAGLERIVDLAHDFVGRDALRRAERDGPATRLVGLVGPNGQRGRSARQGCAVHSNDGREVGIVTSGGPSPTLKRSIAMAYVNSDFSETGTALLVDVRSKMEPVEVTTLPFYRRQRGTTP